MSDRRFSVYLGLGSNVQPEQNIAAGIAALEATMGEIQLSPAYRTRSVGFDGEDFINLAAHCSTDMQPLELKAWLNDLENQHGRARDVPKFSDRTLDIDILLVDDLWVRLPGLEIPRPEIESFAHVLRPLADLAPDFVYPSSGQTLSAMWQAFAQPPIMEPIEL